MAAVTTYWFNPRVSIKTQRNTLTKENDYCIKIELPLLYSSLCVVDIDNGMHF